MYKQLSAPLTVQLELTDGCPNSCVHCYNYWRDIEGSHQNTVMSEEQAERVMRELAVNKVFHVVATGGEPLLNRIALRRVLDCADEQNITVSLNSTVIGLTQADAEILKRHPNFTNVIVSVTGPTADVHDRIVQRKGAFNQTLIGLDVLRKNHIN